MKRVFGILLRVNVAMAVMASVLLAPQHFAWASAPETRVTGMLDAVGEQVVPLPWPATHVVARWDGEFQAQVQIRGAKEDGTWGSWIDALVEEDGGEVQESSVLIVDDAVELQARVVSGVVNKVRFAAIDTENGPRKMELVRNSSDRAHAIDGHTSQPPIIRRSEWGADESIRRGSPSFAAINRVVVHHTATSNSDPNPAATVRAIYAWHVTGNGWNDVGYNFMIDQAGRIYEGRYSRAYSSGEIPTGEDWSNRGVIGAHAVGANSGSVGIAMLGTFTGSAPTAAQQTALTKLIAWKVDRHNIDPMAAGKVVAHRDVGQTTCPGNGAYALMGQWRERASIIKLLAYPPGNTPGYWITSAAGAVTPFGAAQNLGSMAGKPLNAPMISMTSTKSAAGYWLLGADGGIFSFGDAKFHGSTGGMRLNRPVVGMAATPSGDGYWLVASDGGIFSFGDAAFHGSTGAMRLNKPVVGMAPTPSGNGYWLVASDGGIFSFGDAAFHGSTGAMRLNSPVTTIATKPGGDGYWLMAKDGGVFSFGSAQYFGSIPALRLSSFAGARQAVATSTGKGYYVLADDGGVYTFGDARFHGATSGRGSAAALSLLPV